LRVFKRGKGLERCVVFPRSQVRGRELLTEGKKLKKGPEKRLKALAEIS